MAREREICVVVWWKWEKTKSTHENQRRWGLGPLRGGAPPPRATEGEKEKENNSKRRPKRRLKERLKEQGKAEGKVRELLQQ
jgi:hypothetical protein